MLREGASTLRVKVTDDDPAQLPKPAEAEKDDGRLGPGAYESDAGGLQRGQGISGQCRRQTSAPGCEASRINQC